MPCTCGSLSPTRCLCTIDEALRNIDVDLCSTIPLSSAQTDALKSTEDALRRCNATFRAANDYNRRVLVYFRLIPIIDRLYTLTSVEGADAFDGLAECLLHQRIWDSAIEAAQSVLKTREEPRFGGAGVGTAYDRGKSRKAMAKALEGQGKLLDARVVRLRGKETDTLVCAYAECAVHLLLLRLLSDIGLDKAQGALQGARSTG
ncbi:hypothetical protein DXG01_011408 [Tephrocybe rancida]|nr:hypothetical protein DXG01_011408 [Tephrocybe rancida]